ncbi:hypothetical protein L7F22_034650 [Adiantum nelumboides]|nr:hypothetical protein [Adiantum nelumboides]
MGAERKGAPLPIDIGQCMKYASEGVYCVEVTGIKSKSYLWDQNEVETQGADSIDAIKTEIQKYEGHLKTHGNHLPDKGGKLRSKLARLYGILEEQEKEQAMGPSTLLKEAEQYPAKDIGHVLTTNRFTGPNAGLLSFTNKQAPMTDQCALDQGNGSAFSEVLGIFKGASGNGSTKMGSTKGSSNGSTKMGSTKGSSNGNTCRDKKGKSSFMVSSSSFYSSSRDLSHGFKMEFEDSKLPTEVDRSIAYRVASGKRQKFVSPPQKEKTSSLKSTSSGFGKGLKKAGVYESASGQKSRLFPKLHMQKYSPGASLDTAMELSDDEEERGAEDDKADLNCKDVSRHPYSLRSNFERREGFKVTYPRYCRELVQQLRLKVMRLLDQVIVYIGIAQIGLSEL